MAFGVYEVVRSRQTSHANDFVNAESHAREKRLLAEQRFLIGPGRTRLCVAFTFIPHIIR